jgi:hypothetical protein
MTEALNFIRSKKARIFKAVIANNTLESATREIAKLPMHGMFTAYEVVCDMRHQKGMLDKAGDVMTWANVGPGARRGISRILYGEVGHRPSAGECLEAMRELLMLSDDAERWTHREWPLEMREIEHSLCEWDKYERVRLGEGRPRSLYHHG